MISVSKIAKMISSSAIIKLLVMWMFFPNCLVAQIFDTKGDVAPPAMTSAFMKDMHNGVSYQTGSANFSLDLFSLMVDDGLQIPISISYTTNGIKFNQSSGEIGLGWDFSANYRLTRTLYGRPDEYFPRPSSQQVLDLVNTTTSRVLRDQELTKFTFGLPTNGGMNLRSDQVSMDGEFDMFDYRSPFYSGSFVIADVATKNIMLSENKLLKFDYSLSTTDGIQSFTMNDTKGNVIYYGLDPDHQTYTSEFVYSSGNKASIAWPVMRMMTPNHRSVDFSYNLKDISEGLYPGERAFSINEATSDRADNSNTYNITTASNITDGTSAARRTYLTETISSAYGQVKIFRTTYSEVIDSIVLYDANQKRIKSAIFTRSYSQGYNFLDGVFISGTDGIAIEKYQFGYKDRNIANLVPDIWDNLMQPLGNQVPSDVAYPSELGTSLFWNPSVNSVVEQPVSSLALGNFIDRSPLGTPDYYSLQNITLPTGGKITYIYEPNFFKTPNGPKKQGPGIRIMSEIRYEPITLKSVTTNYVYGNNQDGAGTIPVEITPNLFGLDQVRLYFDRQSGSNLLLPGRIKTFSNSVIADSDPYFARYNVVSYPQVIEATVGNGGKKYYYQQRHAGIWSSSYSLNNSLYLRWANAQISREFQSGHFFEYDLFDKPLLVKEETFDVTNKTILTETFNYGISNATSLIGLKVKPFAFMPFSSFSPTINYNYTDIESIYDFSAYSINFGSNLLTSKQSIEVLGDNQISKTITYTYNNFDQIIKESEVNSASKAKESQYIYANNLPAVSGSDIISQDIVNMKANNYLDEWIEKKTSIASSLVSTQFKTIFPGSNKIRTSYFQSLPSNFSDAAVVNGAVVIDPKYLKSLHEVLSIDSFGNPTTITSDGGVSAAYVYGYKGLYPIAKVIPSSFNQVKDFISQSVLDQINITDANVRTEVNKIRTGVPSSQVTTYTFAPLVGLTSTTNQNNYTTYYDYDGFSRLKNIRDNDRNIIKRYQYQYATSVDANSVVLQMQTFANNNTIGYPVGVFNINGKLIGHDNPPNLLNANNANDYVSIWNSDAANQAIGVLATTAEPMKFKLTLNTGQTAPANLIGCRYYQFDLAYNLLDGVRNINGCYVDFGDGALMRLGKTLRDVQGLIYPPNTSINYIQPSDPYYVYNDPSIPYFIHSYASSTNKTITFYHNDLNEMTALDNHASPGTSLTYLKNFRGTMPQNTEALGGSGYQQATASTVGSISNWNTITSVTNFGLGTGDAGASSWLNVSYSQDFMQYNKNLQSIFTAYGGNHQSGNLDPTFKLSRLKSDWNTYFKQLKVMQISDEDWNREDLSGLVQLQNFVISSGTVDNTNNHSSALKNMPGNVIDNILIQIAAGAGQNIHNGNISIWPGNSDRTPGSNTAVTILKSNGWTIRINNTYL